MYIAYQLTHVAHGKFGNGTYTLRGVGSHNGHIVTVDTEELDCGEFRRATCECGGESETIVSNNAHCKNREHVARFPGEVDLQPANLLLPEDLRTRA